MPIAFNQVTVAGHLVDTPQLNHTPGGMPVVDTSIAINRVTKNKKTGEKETETTFIPLTFWKGQAETAAQYLQKGSAVIVSGFLKMERWKDKDTGKNRSKLKIVSTRLAMLDRKNPEGARPIPEAPTRPPAPKTPEDDVPW